MRSLELVETMQVVGHPVTICDGRSWEAEQHVGISPCETLQRRVVPPVRERQRDGIRCHQRRLPAQEAELVEHIDRLIGRKALGIRWSARSADRKISFASIVACGSVQPRPALRALSITRLGRHLHKFRRSGPGAVVE